MSGVPSIHRDVEPPPRYLTPWREDFERIIEARLREDMTVLDVGSGRNPTIGIGQRRAGTRYVGLDLSGDELLLAGPDAYDERVEADLVTRVESLVGSVDLAVSWQVFEHVKRLDLAMANLYDYLTPGGALVSLFSGTWSAFGVANQLLPNAIGTRLVERSMRRSNGAHPVFPAYYHRCYERALREMMTGWRNVQIQPLFRAATYFHFSRNLTRAYLTYENAAHRAGMGNLATHYLLVAER